MDEQPLQLLQETQVPIAATKQHGERVDDEYERNGFSCLRTSAIGSSRTAKSVRTTFRRNYLLKTYDVPAMCITENH
jgi:hypothetical protein